MFDCMRRISTPTQVDSPLDTTPASEESSTSRREQRIQKIVLGTIVGTGVFMWAAVQAGEWLDKAQYMDGSRDYVPALGIVGGLVIVIAPWAIAIIACACCMHVAQSEAENPSV